MHLYSFSPNKSALLLLFLEGERFVYVAPVLRPVSVRSLVVLFGGNLNVMVGRPHHLLVIDDEPLHRRGVSSLVRALRPEFRVFSARDGVEGLEMMDRNRIDIVLTDIRMARMDGLEFIRRLGSRVNESKVIIVSAYSRFDYARQALRLGAFDYLLKPIGRDDMERILEKTEAALEEEQKRRHTDAQMLQRLQSTTVAYEQQLLNRLVQGELSYESLSMDDVEGNGALFAQLLSAGRARFYLARVSWPSMSERASAELSTADREGSARSFPDDQRTLALAHVREALQGYSTAVSFWLERMQNVLATIVDVDSASDLTLTNVDCLLASPDHAHRIGTEIRQAIVSTGAQCRIGVSASCQNLAAETTRAFDEALCALDSTFYEGSDAIVLHEETRYVPDKPILANLSAETRLGDAIVQLQRDQVAELLNALIDEFMTGAYPSSRHMKENILYLLINRVRALEVVLREEKIGNLIAEMEFRIPQCESLTALRSAALYYLGQLMDGIEERKGNSNSYVLQSCLAYLDEKYSDEITLDTIARRFYFSPAYFSTLFKSYTGLTLTEYLLRLRIEKAKTLLIESREKVAAIAQQVGFRDAGYFARIFRREVGLSPEEFRRNMTT